VADGAIGLDEYGPPLAIDFTDDKNPGLDVAYAPDPAKDTKDLFADLYLAYIRDDLFRAVNVRDDILIDRSDAPRPRENDAVELFLDGDRLGGDVAPGSREGFQAAATVRGGKYSTGVGTSDQDYKVNGTTTARYTAATRPISSGSLGFEQCLPATVIDFRRIEVKELNTSEPMRAGLTDAVIDRK